MQVLTLTRRCMGRSLLVEVRVVQRAEILLQAWVMAQTGQMVWMLGGSEGKTPASLDKSTPSCF
jgi:hypothetical protein